MSTLTFDATTVDPRKSFDPIPAGKYAAVIVASEEKPTKAGTGSYLQLEFQVIEGEFEGRKVWARLNLNNPNDQAVGIARAELSAICRAVGVLKLNDSAQLHDLPITIKVAQRQNKDSGEMGNEIKGYEAKGGTTTKPATAPAAGGTTARPPWKKG